MTEQIHLVMAEWEHSGSTPLRAFPNKKSADEYAEQCRLYHLTKTWLEDSATDADYYEWHEADQEWIKNHPGGSHSVTADFFSVCAVDFCPAVT